MPRLIKVLIAASAVIATSGLACADDTFVAQFNYVPTAPVEVTYAAFQKTAHKACKIDRYSMPGVGARFTIEHACEKKLLADAVVATRQSVLIAYHAQFTAPVGEPLRLADVR